LWRGCSRRLARTRSCTWQWASAWSTTVRPWLRQSDRGADQPVTDRERNLFDEFFLVKRMHVSRAAFVAQLRALTSLVASDVAQRPLYGSATTWDLPAVHAGLIGKLQRTANTVLRDFLHLSLERPCG